MRAIWSRLPLRWKIVLPYVGLMILVAGGASYLAAREGARSASDRLTTELVGAVRAADLELLRAEAARLEALRTLLARDEIAVAAERGDSAHLDLLLDPVPGDAEWVAVTDTAGATLALRRRDRASTGRQALGRSDAINAALERRSDAAGERHAGLIDLQSEPAVVAVAPLLRSDGRTVGAVVVGDTVDALADDARRFARADLALFDAEGRALANTLGPSLLPSMPVQQPGVGEMRPARWRVGERDYQALVAPLRVRDATIGSLVAVLPAERAANLSPETLSLLLVLFGAPIGLAILVGISVADVIARPLLALVGTARALGAGELSRRSGISGRDEVGLLGRTFDGMAENLLNRERQLAEAYVNTVRALAAAVDAKDPYTHGHSQRVATYAVMAARRLGLEGSTLAELEMGGLLHDVGKIGVPDAVLTKPDRPTDGEWALLKRHPVVGAEIVAPVGFGRTVVDVVRHHHERVNGRGYPDGLVGDAIPLVARIASVCDAYDTMTSDRAYRRGLGHDRAVEELRRWVGDQFDGDCVEALIAALPDGPLPAGPAQRAYQPA